jgi:hypothetical protein
MANSTARPVRGRGRTGCSILARRSRRGGSDAEAIRLAELGELRPDELAALHERANEAKTRIGTPSELLSDGKSLDRRCVGLYERVEDALGR